MKKKIMSLALAMVMCMTLCVPAFASDSASKTPNDSDNITTQYVSRNLLQAKDDEIIYQEKFADLKGNQTRPCLKNKPQLCYFNKTMIAAI